ncbi:lisH domain-containing protein [Colletotrichum spaethianum]|uniref:LisH domain-containing protein n=1 Tax=Colletotrichum spaethianum TaxID=700344 RepID=A0AA37LD80_9PEZI|nr:lisH domain-containing protein [Colletotrichum spaethianum]GKT46481.1 lisH domain-containing protein [Colletotrichum spaethianum]
MLNRPNNRGGKGANGKEKKVPNKPFSRIPDEVYVDPKFASNEYVPNDYSQRAHEDLIVTKGKAFTKEKNKKKRGSYRGGLIDISEKKGIKFEY